MLQEAYIYLRGRVKLLGKGKLEFISTHLYLDCAIYLTLPMTPSHHHYVSLVLLIVIPPAAL